MSLIREGYIRMANICVYISSSVNGVSALHSEIIKDEVFNDYYLFKPAKFKNVTNGIAYRRWLLQSNPSLTGLLSDTTGEGFKKDASELAGFKKYAGKKDVQKKLAEIKLENKKRLAEYIHGEMGISVVPESIFDVQAKRMHEYKRQHLNALNIIQQYLYLKDNPNADFVPRTYIFGAKAAPGYYIAKQMIRLICGLSSVLEKDEAVRDKLRVIYLEDYRVSLSEILMPASEVSEQISLAGTEASGTGNMKLMLNGALTIGTLDGANIEIRQAAGEDNFFLFGLTKEEVIARKGGYKPELLWKKDPSLKRILDAISRFGYTDLANNLSYQDPYLVLADYDSYVQVQNKISETYKNPSEWNKMSAMNIAGAGVFSADRAVREYADNIWKAKPVY
jgi:starch phosphorylase